VRPRSSPERISRVLAVSPLLFPHLAGPKSGHRKWTEVTDAAVLRISGSTTVDIVPDPGYTRARLPPKIDPAPGMDPIDCLNSAWLPSNELFRQLAGFFDFVHLLRHAISLCFKNPKVRNILTVSIQRSLKKLENTNSFDCFRSASVFVRQRETIHL